MINFKYIPYIAKIISMKSYPALVLNLLKDIVERSKISFNKFRTSAKKINILNHLNNSYYIIFIIVIFYIPLNARENNIILKSKWKELCNNDVKCTNFGGKWIVVGSITFKRKSKEPIYLNEINLMWQGEKIEHLTASLYRKNCNKCFLAIEDNLICDGIWNTTKQSLILNFDEEQKLGPTTVFYLVLTVPKNIEPILKKGHFCLNNNCLPQPFKQHIQQEKLILAINDSVSQSSSFLR